MNRQPTMLWSTPASAPKTTHSNVTPSARQTFTERNQRTLVYPLYNGKLFAGRWIFNPREWLKLDDFSRVAQFNRFANFLPSGVTAATAAQMATQFAKSRPTSNAMPITISAQTIAPAGQVSSTPVGTMPDGTTSIYGWSTTGCPLDQSGNVIPGVAGCTAGSAAGGSLSPGEVQSISTTVGQVLGMASSDIMAAIQGQNQLQIAQIQAQTQQAIAQLQAQNQTPQTQAQLSALQMVNQMLQAQQSNSSMLIMVGIGAVVLLAGIWLIVSTRGSGAATTRRNPVVRHHGRRKFLSMAHVRRLRGLR